MPVVPSVVPAPQPPAPITTGTQPSSNMAAPPPQAPTTTTPPGTPSPQQNQTPPQ
ncbi:MAG: hypothetical protein JOY79_00470, partial [Acidobacteriaceae bacterium]|nr:hypothetical protein [Acidobacteriaceae bacterium]